MSAPDARSRILSAALEEFALHGAEAASTNSIAASASVAKGLVFHYFGSKTELYDAVLSVCRSCLTDALAALTEDCPMIELWRARAEFFAAHPLYWKLLRDDDKAPYPSASFPGDKCVRWAARTLAAAAERELFDREGPLFPDDVENAARTLEKALGLLCGNQNADGGPPDDEPKPKKDKKEKKKKKRKS